MVAIIQNEKKMIAIITILAMATAIFASDEQVAMTMCLSLLSVNMFLYVSEVKNVIRRNEETVYLSPLWVSAIKMAQVIFFDAVICVAFLGLQKHTALGVGMFSLLNIIMHHVHDNKKAKTELSTVAVMVFDEVIGIMTVFAIASPETEAFFREWNILLLVLIMMGFLYRKL